MSLPRATIKRMMKEEMGMGQVSDAAITLMSKLVDEYVAEITAEAFAFAKHAQRKTVKAEDIELVMKG